ncbi:MAG TPA: helix-turn-helix domain-containing protein [Vitreimonas sp.]|nr:helix-turn-helix domain-containing protein [Vitreimonas sp.]
MGTAPRRRIAVGSQVRRWRRERGLTLAAVAERSGLNVGYLSQIENDKAVPSLDALASLAEALDVPPAWFLFDEVPAPRIVRAAERPTMMLPGGRAAERIDGGLSRGFSMLHLRAAPGTATGPHSHDGEEHHLVLRGRWRVRQGDHELELGPGDYVAWDGTIPHDAEVLPGDEGEILIVSRRVER